MNKRELAFKIAQYSETLDKLNWVARWRDMMAPRSNGVPVFDERVALFGHVNQLVGERPVTYLEFGVASGGTMRAWVELNKHPQSRFHGFDTFEGLPDDWNTRYKRGAFSTHGKLPDIGDDRVELHVGLFQDTLRPFLSVHELRGQLVVHLDADIYSATLFALTQLDAHMPAGTIVMFDEYQSFLHEFRAWADYLVAYRRDFKLLGYATRGVRAAVQDDVGRFFQAPQLSCSGASDTIAVPNTRPTRSSSAIACDSWPWTSCQAPPRFSNTNVPRSGTRPAGVSASNSPIQ